MFFVASRRFVSALQAQKAITEIQRLADSTSLGRWLNARSAPCSGQKTGQNELFFDRLFPDVAVEHVN